MLRRDPDHSRTLALEESFFHAMEQYFQTTPVTGLRGEDSKIYICRRWRTEQDWSMPTIQSVMNGSRSVVRGRGYGLIDQLFGSIEL